jgi:hypothetical protein
MCSGVVRACGAERARFRADAYAHADAALATAASARRRKRFRDCRAVRTVEYDRASEHNGLCEASADAAETQCHPPGGGNGARTRACAAVALPDRRS